MSENFCKRCNFRLVIDNLATAQAYNKDTGKIIDKDGNIILDNAPDYVILKCMRCGTIVKKSFEELLFDYKMSFLQALVDVRRFGINTDLSNVSLREESGMSYCGYCPGIFDGDGYCLNDMKNKCVVRKFCIDRKNGTI